MRKRERRQLSELAELLSSCVTAERILYEAKGSEFRLPQLLKRQRATKFELLPTLVGVGSESSCHWRPRYRQLQLRAEASN